MRIYIIFLIFSLFFIQSIFAVLGEKSSSVNSVRKLIQAKTHTIKNFSSFSVHELIRDGLTLREYANNEGTVFAVVWQGVTHPDLKSLLGSHHEEFHRALNDAPPTNRQKFTAINSNDLVVEKSGHMRAVRGRAYVPSLLPAGMNLDEIK